MVDDARLNKVPAVTLAFWIAKIAATTLGETGGDAVSMSMNFGYLAATGIFAVIFVVALALQVAQRRYRPFNYWFVIVATTTVGTTISDYPRSHCGSGLSAHLANSVRSGPGVPGRMAPDHRQHLSRAGCGLQNRNLLLDHDPGLEYARHRAWRLPGGFQRLWFEGGAMVFGGLIGVVAAAYFATRISHTILFWAAFILTRPLGATLGDILTKPRIQGGLNLDRIESSLTLAAFMTVCIVATNLRKPAPTGAMAH